MRRGFTVIELMVVISVIAILSAIATPVIWRSMGRARVAAAADQIVRVHLMARQLALTAKPFAPGEAVKCYGVALLPPGADGRFAAALLYGTSVGDILPADDDHDGQPDAGGRPVARLPLAPSTAIWIDDGADAGGAPSLISPRVLDAPQAWFYLPRTGRPVRNASMATDPAKHDWAAVHVGVPSQAGTSVVYLSQAGDAAATSGRYSDLIRRGTRPLISPRDIHLRHLSVRSRSGPTRFAIAIYDLGLESVQEF